MKKFKSNDGRKWATREEAVAANLRAMLQEVDDEDPDLTDLSMIIAERAEDFIAVLSE